MRTLALHKPPRPLALSVDALRNISFGWYGEFVGDEIGFFARWKIEWLKFKEWRRYQGRLSYDRHIERRRQDARRQRIKNKSDPVKVDKERVRARIKMAKLLREDPNARMRFRIRNRIWMSLDRGIAKAGPTVDLLGCSIPFFRKYLEARWLAGMSWENYGRRGWHIDHVKPCADFDLSKPSEQRKCFHYTNCAPMWAFQNLSKGSKTLRQGELPI